MDPESVETKPTVGRPWKEGSTDIGFDQLCAVRALTNINQLQIKEVEGKKEVYLPTTIEGTKGEYPRTTIHLTLNHKVSLNIGDEWMGSPIVVLAPMEAAIKKNGKPENINAVDTFWSKGMVLAQGSKILFLGDIPEEFKDGIEGIQVYSLDIDKDKLEELEKIKEECDNNYSMETEDRYYDLGREIDGLVNEKVYPHLTEMGYTVLDQDHNTYMGEEKLDLAISLLARREGIETSYIHADTVFGSMEGDFFQAGPLPILSEFKLEYIKVDKETNSSVFSNSMRLAAHIFSENEIKFSGENDLVLIFSAELFKVLNNNPEIIDESVNAASLQELFNNTSYIKEIISKWSEKDKLGDVGKVIKHLEDTDS